MMKTNYHLPVLLEPAVEGLQIKPDGTYVDVTFGGGGHARKILELLNHKGRLIAFDQDAQALQNAPDDPRIVLINENFRYIKPFLKLHGVRKVNGILGDLGVSSHQFDMPDRGFSTRFDNVLDMRMNQRSSLTAGEVINQYSEADLKKIFAVYGEIKSAAAMAKQIVSVRQSEPITTSKQLQSAIARFLPKHRENKVLAQVYQAIRIEVNQELEALQEFLLQTPDLLVPGGRLSLISYHSLEDRLVKRFMKSGLFYGEPEKDIYGNVDVPLKPVGKLIVPTPEEIDQNNRARSAKLRIAERL